MSDQNETTETGDFFDEGALMAAATAALESDEEAQADDAGGAQGEAVAADSQGQADADSEEKGPMDLAKLRKIAADRAKAHQGQAATQAATDAAPAPDFAKLAESMSGAAAYKAAIEAAASGDFSQVAKLAGKDEASLYETWTQRALKGDAHAVEAKMAALEAKIAELEGKKLPDSVLTEEKLQEMRAREYAENARAQFKTFVKAEAAASKYPLLSRIDAEEALRYGVEADGMLEAAGLPRDFDSISNYAEQLLRERIGGALEAQQSSGRAQQASGERSEAAATSANSGSKGAGVTIDNRAAAETASSLPDITDEAAFVARARRAAEAM